MFKFKFKAADSKPTELITDQKNHSPRVDLVKAACSGSLCDNEI